MRIAQIAPLTEAIPPKLYGGTELVISWLADELVALGHDVVLFASGDSQTSANLEACWPKALRLDGSVRDPNALHMSVLERVANGLMISMCCTSSRLLSVLPIFPSADTIRDSPVPGRDALQAWMAQDGDGAARNHGDGLHVHGEGVDLHAVDLVASEGTRGLLGSGLF